MVELRFVDAAEHQAGHFSSESNTFSLPSGESRLSDYCTFGWALEVLSCLQGLSH